MQSLVEKEFKMTIHREQKPMDVYVLSVGKKGSKLPKAAGDGAPNCRLSMSPQMEAEATCTNETMAELATDLPRLAKGEVDRPVVDETGLAGGFDFKLDWVRQPMIDQGGLTIFDAVDKMLGLKLEAQKRPVTVIVIDHIEKLGDQ
jgi:uncharacterized protein (TIGR03435 family)